MRTVQVKNGKTRATANVVVEYRKAPLVGNQDRTVHRTAKVRGSTFRALDVEHEVVGRSG